MAMLTELKAGQEKQEERSAELRAGQEKFSTELSSQLNEKFEKLNRKMNEQQRKLRVEFEEVKGDVEGFKTEVCQDLAVVKEKLGLRIAEVESRISTLEDTSREGMNSDSSRSETVIDREVLATSEVLEERLQRLEGQKLIPLEASVRGLSGQKPPTFSGKTSWSAYLKQFEMVAELNQWTEVVKGIKLATSLQGQALGVFDNLSEKNKANFESLSAALEHRFGDEMQKELNRTKLRTRIQKKGETLSELGEDIEKLVRRVYGNSSEDLIETLVVENFIQAIYSGETKYQLRLRRPKTIIEAISFAMQVETARGGDSKVVRRAVVEESEEDKWKKMAEIISETIISKLPTSRVESSLQRKSVTCWKCGKKGHTERFCRSPVSKKNEQASSQQENRQGLERGGPNQS